jgi:hypothetical protein
MEIDRRNQNEGLKNAIMLPGYLRAEVVLGVQNEIAFAVGENVQVAGQPVSATENRLQMNDAFYITHYSVMFATWVTATAGARVRAGLHTFANGAVFGLNAPSVEGAYNGRLSLRVDDTVFMDSMDMLRFKAAGTAQEGLAVSTAATNNAYTESRFINSEAFAQETDPLVRLNGMSRNQFRIALPDTLDFGLVVGSSVSAVLYLRGWLAQNSGAARTINQ